MSLVAYAASSDEESENDECEPTKPLAKVEKPGQSQVSGGTGTISDDEDYAPVGLHEVKKPGVSFLLSLPKPKTVLKSLVEELEENLTPTFAKLPMPKATSGNRHIIEEEDDEFLRKKAVPLAREKPPPPPAKCPVKITIPSLREFSDVDKDLANKVVDKGLSSAKSRGTGLLGILPKAKSERNFVKANEETINPPSSNATKRPAFIPDTVKNRRPAHNTEGVDGFKATVARKATTNVEKPKIPLVNCSDDSEASDGEEASAGGDFFSLNAEYKLPEVSTNEINAMVAKRAAKMAEATTKYLDAAAAKEAADTEEREQPDGTDEMMQQAQKRYHERQLDGEAMQALVGGSAKRRRKQQANIQVLDISSAQVLPDREEWMRTALASSTTYQPTGVLTDEEPAAGTRRKHQITYLAHKAKANEAELQAMWATNRQNRRATQSKYGF